VGYWTQNDRKIRWFVDGFTVKCHELGNNNAVFVNNAKPEGGQMGMSSGISDAFIGVTCG